MPSPEPVPRPIARRPHIRALTVLALLMSPLASCSGAAEEPPLAGATIGGDFVAVDKAGKTVRFNDFAGKWRIVYFGYSFCPDVCPLDLQHLMQGYHAFAKASPALAKDVQPMFVTIDPERDTPKKVGEYTANFGPELLGLTGTPAQIAAAANTWKVYYARNESKTPGSYLMDHSRAAYLMDRAGKPIALLPSDKDGAAVAAELQKWVH
ncbi:MAG: SCO family protein [Novosphingobium sp.]|nr:SCO family protein [Novosphingobium sp.]